MTKLYINNIDYSYLLNLPVAETYALDESLDNAVVYLKNTKISTNFKPFSKVRIEYNNNDITTYYLAQDYVEKIIGGNYYNHKLTLIEETKILEKIVVDTNTITQPKEHDYFAEQTQAILHRNNAIITAETPATYLTPIEVDTDFTFESFNALFSEYGGLTQSPEMEIFKNNVSIFSTTDRYENKTITLEIGLYKVQYSCIYYGVSFEGYYEISVIPKPQKSQYYSITDVVNRLLNICETLKVGETPRFTFNQAQAEKYGTHYVYQLNENPDTSTHFSYNINFQSNNGTNYTQISCDGSNLKYGNTFVYSIFGLPDNAWNPNGSYKIVKFLSKPTNDLSTWLSNNATEILNNENLSPEFSFTRGTLREALNIVGGYIHAIPRLEDDVIYFDELGENEEIELPDNYINQTTSQDIEQYCSNIDTHAENLLNLENSKSGVLVEPYLNGYDTVRAESGQVRITDTTAIIETEYPIAKIAQLKVGLIVDNGGNEIGPYDLAPYVYENTEYQTLSSYENNYPYSKAYAIYYTIGEKNIKGLNFKLDNAISPIFENYAIHNIIERVSQYDVANLLVSKPFVQLNFQIVYYPLVSARIGQAKINYKDYNETITSIYNQNSNMIDSSAYGEHLKGVVARLGNIDKKLTYIFKNYSEIAKIGTIVNNDYYISLIELAHYGDYIKCTYSLSKDFNRLSQYIGIKNQIRMYEISERQVEERYILSQDYFIISEQTIPYSNNNAWFNYIDNGLNNVILSLLNEILGNSNTTYASAVLVETDAVSDTFILPVASLGIGNSIVFTFSFKDNYSAGNTASQGSSNGTPDNQYYNVQNYAPYGDFFGKFNNMRVRFVNKGLEPTNSSEAIAIGNKLPILDTSLISGDYEPDVFSDFDVQVYKDNREKIIYNHQINWVTDNKDIVIGSALSNYSNLVGCQYQAKWKVYLLPAKIKKFSKKIDLTNATLLTENITTLYDNQAKTLFLRTSLPIIAPTNGKSYAVIREINNENLLIFGKNIDIIENEQIILPSISLRHTIRS